MQCGEKVNTQFNKLPILEVSGTSLFDSSAIAYYLSNGQLRGESELAQAQVLQWVNYADNDILPAAIAWVLPTIGLVNNKQVSIYFFCYKFYSMHFILRQLNQQRMN